MRAAESISRRARIQTRPVLLQTHASRVQQFRPPVSFPETQHFGSAFLRRSCVGKGSGGGVLEPCSAKPPCGSPHSPGCLTLSAAPLSTDGSIDSALGSLCPGCPPHPFCPQDAQVHPRAAILAPGAEDRVLLGRVQVASPLPALGNWGLLTC